MRQFLVVLTLFVSAVCTIGDRDNSPGLGIVYGAQSEQSIPATASEYARLVGPELGVVPTINCGVGVRPPPIHVDGVEVFEDQQRGQCDNPDFKDSCRVGSRVGRLEGTNANGTARPDVVWAYLCRSQGVEALAQGVASVQIIGHNTRTGATAFFEAPDADPTNTNDQTAYLRFDENGLLDGALPGPDEMIPNLTSPSSRPPYSAHTAIRRTLSYTTHGSMVRGYQATRVNRSSLKWQDRIRPTT